MEHKSIIPGNTGYKILEYLVKLYKERVMIAKYENDSFIRFLIDRQYLIDNSCDGNKAILSQQDKKRYISGRQIIKYRSTPAFNTLFDNDLLPLYLELRDFINKHRINYIENTCCINEIQSLMELSNNYIYNQEEGLPTEPLHTKLTFQEILARYFSGSKHTQPTSNLAKAIYTVIGGDENIDQKITNQALSILFPKETSRYIVLCENINRIGASRHQYIEYWYAGGRNTRQLKYIPSPNLPIFYLFDWDYDGISIYLHIKENYFPTLQSIPPPNYKSLALPQTEVKHHRSKWRGEQILTKLTNTEQEIVTYLIDTDSIIEEQRIDVMTIEKLIR